MFPLCHPESSATALAAAPQKLLTQLRMFAGHWLVQVRHFPASPYNTIRMQGHEHHDWLKTEACLKGQWQLQAMQTIYAGSTMLGYDELARQAFLCSYNAGGWYRRYLLQCHRRRWHLTGSTERATRQYAPNVREFTESWELKNSSGNWVPYRVVYGMRES